MASQRPARLIPVADHRNFDAEDWEFPAAGPVFELGGETFHCVPFPAGGTLARLAASVRVNDRGVQIYDAPNLVNFIEDVLAEELPAEQPLPPEAPADSVPVEEMQPCDDIARWRVLMADKKRPIPLQIVGEIVGWLSNWYTDRPTQPSGR